MENNIDLFKQHEDILNEAVDEYIQEVLDDEKHVLFDYFKNGKYEREVLVNFFFIIGFIFSRYIDNIEVDLESSILELQEIIKLNPEFKTIISDLSNSVSLDEYSKKEIELMLG